MTIRPKEAEIQRACLQLLKLRGVLHFRMNSGALRNAKGRPVPFGFAGCPDVLALVPGSRGRLLAAEVKRPGGKATAAQLAVLDALRDAGAVALVVDDVKQLEAALDALANDPDWTP